ncbi:MAG TPA: hypothetical protein VKI65_05505 [Gemmataceae bacterium]|nr:hypothetical protein [Gemmataceae bacterium]
MSWYRYLFLPLLVCLVVVITGALAQQTAPPPKSKNPAQAAGPKAPPPKSDAKAAKILDEAVKKLDLSETPWIKAKIWQRVDTQSLAFTAEGDYRAGPDQRLYLELNVTVGETKGKLLIVCDGKKLWHTQQIGGTPSILQWVDMNTVRKHLQSSETAPEARENFLVLRSFTGIAPLLKSLAQQLTFAGPEETTWRGRPVFKLTGVWPRSAELLPEQWPPYVPRDCVLYLDRDQKYWPLRLEWRGPTQPRASTDKDVVLVQMEFRNPELFTKQPAWKFDFDPGANAELYENKTQEWANGITAMSMQMAAQKKPPPGSKQAPPSPPQRQ